MEENKFSGDTKNSLNFSWGYEKLEISRGDNRFAIGDATSSRAGFGGLN